MSYGFITYNDEGKITLDNKRLLRLRYFTVAAVDTAGSISLPDIAGLKSLEFAIPTVQPLGYSHDVYRTGTTLYWDLSGESVTHSSFIYLFLYT